MQYHPSHPPVIALDLQYDPPPRWRSRFTFAGIVSGALAMLVLAAPMLFHLHAWILYSRFLNPAMPIGTWPLFLPERLLLATLPLFGAVAAWAGIMRSRFRCGLSAGGVLFHSAAFAIANATGILVPV